MDRLFRPTRLSYLHLSMSWIRYRSDLSSLFYNHLVVSINTRHESVFKLLGCGPLCLLSEFFRFFDGCLKTLAVFLRIQILTYGVLAGALQEKSFVFWAFLRIFSELNLFLSRAGGHFQALDFATFLGFLELESSLHFGRRTFWRPFLFCHIDDLWKIFK